MSIDNELEIAADDKISQGLRFRFGKSFRPTVGLIAWIGRRPNIIKSPHIAPVAIQIDRPGRGSAVFAPHAAAVGVGHPVMFIAVRIDNRQKPDLPFIDDLGRQGIRAVIRQQPINKIKLP